MAEPRRIPHLVRSFYKQQRISIPDNAKLDCLYPFEYGRRRQRRVPRVRPRVRMVKRGENDV